MFDSVPFADILHQLASGLEGDTNACEASRAWSDFWIFAWRISMYIGFLEFRLRRKRCSPEQSRSAGSYHLKGFRHIPIRSNVFKHIQPPCANQSFYVPGGEPFALPLTNSGAHQNWCMAWMTFKPHPVTHARNKAEIPSSYALGLDQLCFEQKNLQCICISDNRIDRSQIAKCSCGTLTLTLNIQSHKWQNTCSLLGRGPPCSWHKYTKRGLRGVTNRSSRSLQANTCKYCRSMVVFNGLS